MLIFDLVCSLSLLAAASLDSSVPLVKIIDLQTYNSLVSKSFGNEVVAAAGSYGSYLYWLPTSGPCPNTCLES